MKFPLNTLDMVVVVVVVDMAKTMDMVVVGDTKAMDMVAQLVE